MAAKRDSNKVPRRPGEIHFWSHESQINDCIATQIYPTTDILIASPVISSTTSEPSGGRARMMVAIVAGCAVFIHFAIALIALHSRLTYCIKLLGHTFIIYDSYCIFYSVTMC